MWEMGGKLQAFCSKVGQSKQYLSEFNHAKVCKDNDKDKEPLFKFTAKVTIYNSTRYIRLQHYMAITNFKLHNF